MEIIKIETTVSADRRKIWEYWTSPAHIIKWNFASEDWHCPKAENDIVIGGKLKSRMEAKDGSFGFDFEAVYTEIIPEKKMAYTLGDGRKVITDFEIQKEGLTKITTSFEAEDANPVEMQRGGWLAILNNFKKYTESA